MILKFYYCAKSLPDGPLVAVARIPGNGNEHPPWDPGTIEMIDFDIRDFADRNVEHWIRRDTSFRRRLALELGQYLPMMHRPALPPWSREAFETIAQYGIPGSGFPIRAELYEDDGTKWDPGTARPLYGRKPGPYSYDD